MARRAEASCCCSLFLSLMLWHGCIFRQRVEGSFANLVKTVTVPSGTTNSLKLKYIYETGPGCVAFTSSTSQGSFIDVVLGTTSSVRTVLIYLPNTGTDYRNIQLSIRSRTHSFKKHKDVDQNIVAIWEGDYSTYMLRITSSESSFTLCLIKVYDVTLEDYCACDDTCNRNADVICDGLCDAPHDCHKVNVALNKPAQMSSSYRESNASYAVNGMTGTTFSAPGYTSDSTQWNCIHTAGGDRSPFWHVDLGKEYTVNSVTIYRRGGDSGRQRMAGVSVTVDGNLCETIRVADAKKEKIPVICNTATRGRFLNITRRESYDRFGPFINLCEVQVWVCKPGYYGYGCTSECSEGCSGEMDDCNIDDGFCTNGCDDGWYTDTCSQECGGGCAGGRCNKTDGRCSQCRPNWTGDRCDDCDAEHYGDGCSKTCGHCWDQNRCDVGDGLCPYNNPRCQPGYTGRYCNESCSPGSYGPDCRQTCGEGCSGACDGTTGHCQCKPGWKESDPFCKEKCDWGTYGKKCSSQCAAGCQNTCDRTTGHCSCRVGYQPPLCDKECDGKTYGQDCVSTCGEGCKDGLCRPKNGLCECGPGWDPWDPLCETPCDPGYHGNCSTECGHCAKDAACDHVTGHCPQSTCEGGFAPPLCVAPAEPAPDVPEPATDVWPIVGAVIGVGLGLMITIVVAASVLYRWLRGRRETSSTHHEGERPSQNSAMEMKMQSPASASSDSACRRSAAGTVEDYEDMEESVRVLSPALAENPYEVVEGEQPANYDKLEMYENTRGHHVYSGLE